ncbi:aspartate transaminase [Variovorax sp. PBL-E5]|uniref:aspartate transaminase n=1 Tax=Variovorax sp. PBL-E5 TaxID=434014 RepID=UPI0013178957|nr:aspartate transaminase [Variovorax sp. PBL-E5]VTU31899.1 Aspartate aminotransferase [Variovorax sp. PBL-E5]
MSPSRISSRIRRIKPSASAAAAERFAELRRQGKDIVNLAIGEPDFDTPAHIREAGCAAIERGETRYTPVAGTLALRQAIAAKLQRENGLDYAPRDIIVTCGAKHALFNALAVTVEEGHEVIIPAPFWVSYPDMVLACDGTPVIVACREEDDFRLTPEALEAAITLSTRWLVFNSPTNPTGTTYTTAQLRALADVLLRHPQVMVLTDDIYEHIRFVDAAPRHLLAIEPALRERTLVVNGVSKTYAMTGWRIGYAAGPADIVAALDMLQSQSTSGVCSISQAAAVVALNTAPDFLPQWVATYRERRDTATRLLNAIPGIRARAPGGAFYLYPHCGGLIGKRTPEGKTLDTDNDVVLFFLEAAGVMVLAGTPYGVSPYFRMSTATSLAQIEEGCARIARAVALLG